MFVKTIANNVKHDKCSTKVGESITFQFFIYLCNSSQNAVKEIIVKHLCTAQTRKQLKWENILDTGDIQSRSNNTETSRFI